jgi:DedD protein
MEKKKILLVAVSVGIFLVIAIGAAIVIFSSRNGVSANAVVMERSNQDTYQAFPFEENVPVYPQIAEELEDSLFPVTPDPAYPFSQSPFDTSTGTAGTGTGASGPSAGTVGTSARNSGPSTGTTGPSAGAAGTVRQENNFYTSGRTGGEARPQSYPQSRVEVRGNERATPAPVIINIPKPESAKPLIPSETPPAAFPQAQAQDKAGTTLPSAKPATVSPARSPAANPAVPAKPAAVPRTAKPATSSRKTYDAYWVQAGSFSIRTHADGAKETLASKGITSIIENQELGGKTFYRVRIGPYISQNEADYWLALVQALGGFEESLVWRNQAQILN